MKLKINTNGICLHTRNIAAERTILQLNFRLPKPSLQCRWTIPFVLADLTWCWESRRSKRFRWWLRSEVLSLSLWRQMSLALCVDLHRDTLSQSSNRACLDAHNLFASNAMQTERHLALDHHMWTLPCQMWTISFNHTIWLNRETVWFPVHGVERQTIEWLRNGLAMQANCTN